jgi:hypothetical protein
VTFLSFDSGLSGVVINLAAIRTALGHDDTIVIERTSNGVNWAGVRGGQGIAITTSSLSLTDCEFDPEVVNTYRATPNTGSVQTDTITPSLGGTPWLKHPRFPFLNIPVTLSDAADITRSAQSGSFSVVNRALPVSVTVARASAQFSVTIATETLAELGAVNGIIEPGDVLLLHVPPDYLSLNGSGYYLPGDATETRNGLPASGRRWVTVALTESAMPDLAVTAIRNTWQGIIDTYATWSDLIADKATWSDVLATTGAPGDIVVP